MYLYNSDGTFAKELKSQSEAVKFLDTSLGVVQRAIITKTKVKGYFISNEKFDKFVKDKKSKEIHTIYQYDLNGNFLAEYPSCNSIVVKYGKKYNRIITVLKMGNKKCGDFL